MDSAPYCAAKSPAMSPADCHRRKSLEAAVIRSRASKPVAFAAGLVGTPATVEAAPTAARIAKGLVMHNKGR